MAEPLKTKNAGVGVLILILLALTFIAAGVYAFLTAGCAAPWILGIGLVGAGLFVHLAGKKLYSANS